MDVQSLKPYLDWLQMNPQWGGVLAFLVAFAESIAIVGLIIPGAVVMSAIGVLVGTGILPITSTLIYAGLGAFLGDLLSFVIGYHYSDHIREVWPFRTVPHWLDKSEKFFAAHGGKSIILGRFIGVIRPLLPAIVGSLKMKPLKFIAYDFPASMLWSPVYMAPGYLLGAFSLRFPKELATQMLLYSIAILLLIWLLYWIIKKTFIVSFRILYRFCSKLWIKWRQHHHYSRYTDLMAMKRNPHYPFPFMLFISSCLAAGFFFLLSIPMITTAINQHIDKPITLYMQQMQMPWLQVLTMGLQFLGSVIVLAIAWISILFWLIKRKQFIAVWHWLIVIIMGFGILGVLMRLFAAPQQRNLIEHYTSMTFPSLEMGLFVLIVSFLNIIVLQAKKPKRWFLPTITIICFISVSLSKIYLDLIWFSDLIAASLLALSIVGFAALSYLHNAVHIIHLNKKSYMTLFMAFLIPWLLVIILDYLYLL